MMLNVDFRSTWKKIDEEYYDRCDEEKKSKTATALMMFEHTHTTHIQHTLTQRFSATRVYVHGRRGSSYTGTATFREP